MVLSVGRQDKHCLSPKGCTPQCVPRWTLGNASIVIDYNVCKSNIAAQTLLTVYPSISTLWPPKYHIRRWTAPRGQQLRSDWWASDMTTFLQHRHCCWLVGWLGPILAHYPNQTWWREERKKYRSQNKDGGVWRAASLRQESTRRCLKGEECLKTRGRDWKPLSGKSTRRQSSESSTSWKRGEWNECG